MAEKKKRVLVVGAGAAGKHINARTLARPLNFP